ncbi:MAG TPA: ATP-dependent DNA helicase RecG, partial [Rhodospirillaceae bacterium]|nr:ATP-dependent DNA helicase RecG [Rhodospirillaceae bacterium]
MSPSVSQSMRPEILYPLFAPISVLPGLGPRLAPLAERLAGPHVADLLWHLPAAVVDRRFRPGAAEAPSGRIATFRVTVERHWPAGRGGRPGVVLCADASGPLRLVFFHGKGDWLAKQLPLGSERIVSGLVDRYQGEAQIAHPDYILPPEQEAELPEIEAVYPLTAGLAPKILAKAAAAALARAPDLAEWHDPALLRREGWPSWRAALTDAHHPTGEDALSPTAPARRRLAYDELLANQLALALVRRRLKDAPGRAFAADGGLRRRLLEGLPFALTGAQERAL